MNSKEFEQECLEKLNCWLWDAALNSSHQESVTLSVREMRLIANQLRIHEGREVQRPRPFTKTAADASLK